MDLACAHCGARTPMGTAPSPGDMLFCVFCGGIAIWDIGGGWRDMTKEEHLDRVDDAGYLAAADHLMQVRAFIEKDRADMIKVITRRLRGCVYPWVTTEAVATGVADSLIRSGFHAAHTPEDTDGS